MSKDLGSLLQPQNLEKPKSALGLQTLKSKVLLVIQFFVNMSLQRDNLDELCNMAEVRFYY